VNFIRLELYLHVLTKKPFVEAAKTFPNDADAIMAVYDILKKGAFKTPHELKQIFPSLDNFKYKQAMYVIDIGGNNLRLLAIIRFEYGKVFVKHIVTHTEYDKLCERYRRGELS